MFLNLFNILAIIISIESCIQAIPFLIAYFVFLIFWFKNIQDIIFKGVYEWSVRSESEYIVDEKFPWFEIKKTTKVMNYEYKIIFYKIKLIN